MNFDVCCNSILVQHYLLESDILPYEISGNSPLFIEQENLTEAEGGTATLTSLNKTYIQI